MYQRHEEVPVYETRRGWLLANHYNQVQVAHKRLGESLRLVLPGLKTLELILQRDAWIVVDRALNDLPVIAWSDFNRAEDESERTALHTPVSCRIRLYHANAGMLLKRILAAKELLLTELLEEQTGAESAHKILPFDPST